VRTFLALLGCAAVLASDGGLLAARTRRASPHETTSATIDGALITIAYGRPYMRGRRIMGGLVPYDRVWATGADEATTLATTRAIRIGEATLDAGRYSLWTLPSAGTWTLIVNRQTGQWHTQYDARRDFARIDLATRTLDKPVEQLTISIEKGAHGGGVLAIAWELTEVSVPFTVLR